MLSTLFTLALAAAPSKEAASGYDTLLNGDFVTCGVPYVLWQQLAGPAKPSFPGRRGLNARLPDEVTAVRSGGIDVVAPNCLGCHAGWLRGKRVMGLGNAFVDETVDWSGWADTARAGRAFLPPGPVRDQVDRWLRPMQAIGRRTQLDTRGVSAADDLAAILMAHRDPKTLAWSAKATLPLPSDGPVPIDVPAWWLARSKTSVFWTGSGHGDRAALAASASLLCTDSTAEAERIIASFKNVPAYFDTLEPPAWPFPLDAALVSRGEAVFDEACGDCHKKPRVIPLEKIGTDPVLAERTATEAAPQVAWFNASVYGRTAQLEATRGYIAQPLTGVWATAPYFHNGSVPTLLGVLDSSQRPTAWRRPASSSDYDPKAVGWKYGKQPRGKHSDPSIYDTTKPGYSNAGHTYGDELSAADRLAVLEYLKTL